MTDQETAKKKFSKKDVLSRLEELEYKKNKCRVDSRTAIEEEHKRNTEGQFGRLKREKREAEAREEKFKETLKEEGIDPERYFRLHDTLEVEETKRKRKNKRCDAGEIDQEGDESAYRAFKKRTTRVEFDSELYEKQKANLGGDFYDVSGLPLNALRDHKDTSTQLSGLKDELQDNMDRKSEFSRRRKYSEDGVVDYINERNRKFSQKIARAYDPYTAQIRENLERGTAL
jgi:pre-mRNA-splicing factor SYF2